MDDVFHSVFSKIDAFVYRCKNDREYTMEVMEGAVTSILGYPKADIIGNAKVSFVKLTIEEDTERVFAEVDAAIEADEAWDVAYQMKHADGGLVHVRDRGRGVFVDGELSHLEGMIVNAQAEMSLR